MLFVSSLIVLAVTAIFAATAFLLAVSPRHWRRWPALLGGWHRRLAVVGMSMAGLALAAAQFHAVTAPVMLSARNLGITRSEPVPGVHALTDLGTEIAVQRLAEPVASGEVPDGYEGRLIVAGGAEAASNCHGWVFTDGEFCVDGASVDAILHDNGYVQVDNPRPMDVVVYRDAEGVPVHTGIVKAKGRRGFVLVESKWGQLDVYWHTPEDQRYAEDWEYWRSDRDGHLLELRRETPPGTRPR